MMNVLMAALPRLRFHPTLKRIRVRLGAVQVADTTRAMLIWEPMRVTPVYAVPFADISAELVATAPEAPREYHPVGFGPDIPRLLDPTVSFSVHTAAGSPLELHAANRVGHAFRLASPGLSDYVAFDFAGFEWWEEDELVGGVHPRDPFHRIDVRLGSRPVRLEHQGIVLAETNRAHILFEGGLPLARYYLPREDVRVELRPGTLRTTCAYKGRATHYTAVVDGQELPNIAWSYQDPLPDSTQITGLVSFYQERITMFIDGQPVRPMRTPWS